MPLIQAQATAQIAVLGLTVTLDPLPQNVLTGDLVHFTGRVTSNGTGMEGQDTHIWHNASGTDVASALSGVDGYFDVPWIIPFIVGSGAYETTLPCASHPFYAWTPGAEQSNLESMTVAYRTRITNLNVTNEAMPAVDFPIEGNLQYEVAAGVWAGLEGKRVDVTYNGNFFGYYPATTADGSFFIWGNIPTSGNYTLTTTYTGDVSLGASTRTMRLTTQNNAIPIAVSALAGLVLLYLAR